MQEQENKQEKLQQKSHELLLKILNNIGIVGAIIAAIADIIFVIIFTVGIEIDISMSSNIIFAFINAVIGIIINSLLRYQGQKYAEVENEELCKKFYKEKAKEKKYISIEKWQILNIIKDIFIKGGSAVFSIFGMVYISIQGSHNPIQILITLATLALFACFGLISMNNSYTRYYNVQVPYMELKIKEKENKTNGTD